MARRSVASIVEKQIARTSGATDEVRKGVAAVTESPMEKAAANLDKAAANYAESVRSGKMARNLRSVTLPRWKEATLAKVDRIPTGIANAKDKLVEFHTQRAAHQDKIDGMLASMPKRTMADSQARMIKQMTEMAKFGFIRGS